MSYLPFANARQSVHQNRIELNTEWFAGQHTAEAISSIAARLN